MKKELITIEGATILVWELTETIENLASQLHLNDSEITKFNKIVSVKRKLEFLGIRTALKTVLGKEVPIDYDDEGKPHLSDESFQISISHSNRWIAIILHPTKRVGIDIECPTDKILKLYKRFLSPVEQAELSHGKDIRQLLIAWSAKEALYKIIGKESIDFANQLRIYSFEVKTPGEIRAQHIPSKSYYLLHYQQTENYTLVYCLTE